MNIGFISLGCSKNTVDTEIMMAKLQKSGHKIVNSLEKAEAVIINTCGFINEAKEEAINTIIETGSLKKYGILRYLIATGCLVQRYGNELLDEMPELDGIIGISYINSIDEALEKICEGKRVSLNGPAPDVFVEKGPRYLTTPPGLAYLKIAEGCNNRCSYCTIPSIRGNLRSRPVNEIYDEACELVNRGIKELVVIAQDTTAYGKDLYGNQRLNYLLEKLAQIDNLDWIRVMYLHPASIDQKLIEVIAAQDKVIPYLDIPVQHASDQILRKMNRRHDIQSFTKLIKEMRSDIDGLVLRTTIMVGFPGESEDDFRRLYDFVGETRFDWLGSFAFVPEEGTPAFSMDGQIPEEIKAERRDIILKLQHKITRRRNIGRLNTEHKILISSQIANNLYIGRGYYQAPEVDGITMVKSNSRLPKGEFANVVLKGVRNYDMIGELVDESTK